MGSKVSFAVVDPGNRPRGPELSLVLDQTESRRVWMTVPHSHLSEGSATDLVHLFIWCTTPTHVGNCGVNRFGPFLFLFS